MRRLSLLAALALFAAACSETPTNPLDDAPTIQATTVITTVEGTTVIDNSDPLCGGLSPCDAYRYDYDGNGQPDGFDGSDPLDGVLDSITVDGAKYALGISGFCFLSPVVENHLSDPACSGDFVPGLTGFELVAVQVYYDPDDLDAPPSLINPDPEDPADAGPNVVSRTALVQSTDGEFYQSSVKFNRRDRGNTYRLYVVRGDIAWAHRDVIVDPNLTTPADGYVKAIGTGNEPIKVRIQSDVSCTYFDTQDGVADNAATCLIIGDQSFTFDTDEVSTTFYFPEGNDAFVADFEISECLTLGFYFEGTTALGNALVDTPLADCKISLSSEEVERLDNPYNISVTLQDPRWFDEDGDFANARLNIIQTDEFGTATLPYAADRGWGGQATNLTSFRGLVEWGFDKLAGFFGPQPLHAWPSSSWDASRISDFQISVMALQDFDETMSGVACDSELPSCLDLGTVSGANPTVQNVAVKVTAPTENYDFDFETDPENGELDRPQTYDDFIEVPGTRLHFFPSDGGTVTCPATDPGNGQSCYAPASGGQVQEPSATPNLPGAPALISTWDHVVVITGTDGRALVDWSLGEGEDTLYVNGCGVARPGGNEPNPPGEPGDDGVWGSLDADAATIVDAGALDPNGQQVNCVDRRAALFDASAYDNGPADGFTPFEPVDTENEVAIYGLPLEFRARTCPAITVDGIKDGTDGSEWEACATKTGFSAPLQGSKKGEINAWFYSYDDGESLYMAIEVMDDDLGNRIFLQIAEQYLGDGVAAAGDDILVIDFDDATVARDWYLTAQCAGNNASSLCGEQDTRDDFDDLDGGVVSSSVEAEATSAASVQNGTSGLFFEFRRPLNSPNNGSTSAAKEDLDASSGVLGVKVTKTQGQGGGKGGFVFPDPQGPIEFFPVYLQGSSQQQ